MTVSVALDLSIHFGPARSQGNRGTCMAFAASDLNWYVSKAHDELSAEFLYQSAGALIPGWSPGDGLYASAAMNAIRQPGQPLEVDYPYQDQDPVTVKKPLAPPGKPLYSSDLSAHPPATQMVIDLLRAGHPVGLVMRITDTFFTPAENGIVDQDGLIVPDAYHAVLATGWGTTSSPDMRLLRIRNSWGTGWGDSGYAWLPEKFADLHVLEAFGR